MTMIFQLNLPCPSEKLITLVTDIVANTKLNIDGKYWLDHQHQIDNSAEHLFFIEPSLDSLIQEEFGSFFNCHIGGVIGIMKNNCDTPYAVQPPHVDRGRALAINCYINLGGANVTTSFYDLTEVTNPHESKNYSYQEVKNKKLGSVVFKENQWYAFDVCRCHSIENIESSRYFFSIYLKDRPLHLYALSEIGRAHV